MSDEQIQINEWTVLKYVGNKYYECRCSCGKIKIVSGYSLKKGLSKSCGHTFNKGDRISKGTKFGEWEVDEDLGSGMIRCKCSCGEIRDVSKHSLVYGKSKSCGHNTTRKQELKKGDKFGDWEVIEQINKQWCECRCRCGNIDEVSVKRLRTHKAIKCKKCLDKERAIERKSTMLKRYGDTSSYHINTPRSEEQQIALESAEELEAFLYRNNLIGSRINNIANMLDITECVVLKYIHKYNLEDKVEIGSNTSYGEEELYQFVRSIVACKEVIRNTKQLIYPYEIDMFIPGLNIAIEYNGDYWHSDEVKGKTYHVNKTLKCAERGIKLIHIWEHEWVNKKERIKEYLKNIISQDKQVIYGRNTIVCEIEYEYAESFIDKYHLQGSTYADVSIGCKYNGEIIGAMTFSRPRFDNNYQFELVRFVWKSGIAVVGGAEKLFNYFVKEYEPESIVCYSDISKFRGNTYVRLGFKGNVNTITEPGYCWVNKRTLERVSRYSTQKHKLVNYGLSVYGNTEDEIMKNIGYFKVYDCGNLKLTWKRDDT